MHIKINKTEVAVIEVLAGLFIVLIVSWLLYRR
jgi:hypothetical protein